MDFRNIRLADIRSNPLDSTSRTRRIPRNPRNRDNNSRTDCIQVVEQWETMGSGIRLWERTI